MTTLVRVKDLETHRFLDPWDWSQFPNKMKEWERFVSWMKHITYKPEFQFRCSARDHFFEVMLVKYTIDADNRLRDTTIIQPQLYDLDAFSRMNFEDFAGMLRWSIQKMEMHEMDEFFCADGKRFKDPHAQQAQGEE